MMMSKPSSEKEDAAAPPPSALNVGSVADLERRLAEMGTQKKTPAPAPAPVMTAAPVAAAPPAIKGGKNALLVSSNLPTIVAKE